MKNFKTRFAVTSLFSSLITMGATVNVAHAQSEQSSTSIEEVVILGSRIKRKSQAATSTPLASFGSEDLKNIGAKDTRDLIQTLTINALSLIHI